MRLLVLLTIALAPGCSRNGPPSPYPGPPVAILGTGLLEFLSLTDGQEVPIIHGIQGGYHVWGAVRARYMDPNDIDAHFTLTDVVTGALDGDVHTTLELDPPEYLDGGAPLPGGADGWGESVGTRVFIPKPSDVAGRTMRLQVTLVDSTGRTCSDARTIVPLSCWPPTPEDAGAPDDGHCP